MLLEILYGAKDASDDALDQLLRTWSHFVSRSEKNNETVIRRKRHRSWQEEDDEVKLEVIPEFHDLNDEEELENLSDTPSATKRARLKKVDGNCQTAKKTRDLPCVISIDKTDDGQITTVNDQLSADALEFTGAHTKRRDLGFALF